MVDETLLNQYDRRTDVCGPFCETTPQVTLEDKRGIEAHWCRDCYELDCRRCASLVKNDQNKRKGLCQDCRDEIAQWSHGGENSDDLDEYQTTLADLRGASDV